MERKRVKFLFLGAGLMILMLILSSCMMSPVTYSVSGYVTYNGNGLAGVTISFSDGLSSVTTNSQGYWSQNGLTGSVTITPSMAGYTFNPPNITVTGANNNVNFTSAPNIIYVANAGINNVSVINGQTNTVVQTIFLENPPLRIGVLY